MNLELLFNIIRSLFIIVFSVIIGYHIGVYRTFKDYNAIKFENIHLKLLMVELMKDLNNLMEDKKDE